MKKRDAVFSRSTSSLSKIIQYFDGKWSHVSVAIDDSHVIDSRFPKGVAIRHNDFNHYEVIPANADVDKAKEWLNFRYDVSLFIWLSFRWGK